MIRMKRSFLSVPQGDATPSSTTDSKKRCRFESKMIAKGMIKLANSITDSHSDSLIDPLYQMMDYLSLLLIEIGSMGSDQILIPRPSSTKAHSSSSSHDLHSAPPAIDSEEDLLLYLLCVLRNQRTSDERVRRLLLATYYFGRNVKESYIKHAEKFYEILLTSISCLSHYDSSYSEVERYLELLTILLRVCYSKYSSYTMLSSATSAASASSRLRDKFPLPSLVSSFSCLSSSSRAVRKFIIALESWSVIGLRGGKPLYKKHQDKATEVEGKQIWNLEDASKIYEGFSKMICDRQGSAVMPNNEELEEIMVFDDLVSDIIRIPFHHHHNLLTNEKQRAFFMKILTFYGNLSEEVGESDAILSFMREELIKYFERVSSKHSKEEEEEEDEIEDRFLENEDINGSRLTLLSTMENVLTAISDKKSFNHPSSRRLLTLISSLLKTYCPPYPFLRQEIEQSIENLEIFIFTIALLSSVMKEVIIVWVDYRFFLDYYFDLQLEICRLLVDYSSPSSSSSVSSGTVPLLLFLKMTRAVVDGLTNVLLSCEFYDSQVNSLLSKIFENLQILFMKEKNTLLIELVEEVLHLITTKGFTGLLLKDSINVSSTTCASYQRLLPLLFPRLSDKSSFLLVSRCFYQYSNTYFLLSSFPVSQTEAVDEKRMSLALKASHLWSYFRSFFVPLLKEQYEDRNFPAMDSSYSIRTNAEYQLFCETVSAWKKNASALETFSSSFQLLSEIEAVEFLSNIVTFRLSSNPSDASCQKFIREDAWLLSTLLVLSIHYSSSSVNSGDTAYPSVSSFPLKIKFFRVLRLLEDLERHFRSQTNAASSSLSFSLKEYLPRMDIIPFIRETLLCEVVKKLQHEYQHLSVAISPPLASSARSDSINGSLEFADSFSSLLSPASSAATASSSCSVLFSRDFVELYQECLLSYRCHERCFSTSSLQVKTSDGLMDLKSFYDNKVVYCISSSLCSSSEKLLSGSQRMIWQRVEELLYRELQAGLSVLEAARNILYTNCMVSSFGSFLTLDISMLSSTFGSKLSDSFTSIEEKNVGKILFFNKFPAGGDTSGATTTIFSTSPSSHPFKYLLLDILPATSLHSYELFYEFYDREKTLTEFNILRAVIFLETDFISSEAAVKSSSSTFLGELESLYITRIKVLIDYLISQLFSYN
jgi:hypothetical protein